jgi:NTE family protein
VSEAIIRGRISSLPNSTFDQATVESDLRCIYGIGEFEQIQARIQPSAEGANVLNYDVTEKSWGPTYFKYGLQLRTDFDKDAEWGMLLNLTRMSLNPLGAEWRNEAQIGSVQSLQSEFYQPLDTRGFLFVAPSVLYRSELQDIYEDGVRVAEYDVKRSEGRFDFGVQLRQYAELRAGPLWGTGNARVETGESDLPKLDETYAGAVVSLAVDRQDRTLFAREGYYLKAEGQFAQEGLGGDRSFDRVSGVFREQHSWSDHTITLGLQGGTSLGSDLPTYAQFGLGGPFGFAGLAENQFRGDYQGIGSLGYRYRLATLPSAVGRAVYAMSRLDVGNVWMGEMDAGDLRTGGALGIGADTAIGPIYFAYGRADGDDDRLYFSLGTVF